MIGIQILNISALSDPYKPFPELTVLFIFQIAKIVGQFEGAKGAKIQPEAPICSSSQLSIMAVLSAQKVSGKKIRKF